MLSIIIKGDDEAAVHSMLCMVVDSVSSRYHFQHLKPGIDTAAIRPHVKAFVFANAESFRDHPVPVIADVSRPEDNPVTVAMAYLRPAVLPTPDMPDKSGQQKDL